MNFDSAYALALQQKQKALADKEAKRDAEIQKLFNTSKDYRDITVELSQIGPKLGICAFSGDSEEFKKLELKAKALNEAKKTLILAAGIKDIEYDCDICLDTGYVGKNICECVKSAAADLLLNNSDDISLSVEHSFGGFNLDYYSDEPIGDTSPKKRMSSIYNFALNYTNSFSKQSSENILFVGNTGLGKTYLSIAMYNELIKRGFNVIYKSAFNLFSVLEDEHFNKHTDAAYNDVLSADLLIIDDLGSEFVSSFSNAAFYSIINSRLLAARPTVINTNLSLPEIEKRYSPRVSSRILGNFTVKKFLGKDIRQLKKMK